MDNNKILNPPIVYATGNTADIISLLVDRGSSSWPSSLLHNVHRQEGSDVCLSKPQLFVTTSHRRDDACNGQQYESCMTNQYYEPPYLCDVSDSLPLLATDLGHVVSLQPINKVRSTFLHTIGEYGGGGRTKCFFHVYHK